MRAVQRRAHRRIWLVLAVLLPLGIVLGLAMRPDHPIETRRFDLGAPSPADPS